MSRLVTSDCGDWWPHVKEGCKSTEWNEVLENLDWELSHNPDLAQQNRVLLTTYNYLPSRLKYCFLYCAMFPEDRANEREKIIHMWMGEGFVEEHPRRTLEELEDDYFFQPIDRNLLLPVSPIETWRLEECQMHDLMRDGATSTLKKEEFAGICTKQSNSVQEMPRRMALQSKATDIPRTSLPLNARSFLKFCEDEFPSSLLYRTISDFKFLRVLDLEGSVIRNLPNEIGSLIHLRYLVLRGIRVVIFPESLQRLHNLQILDAWDCNVQTVPSGIIHLVQLRLILLDIKPFKMRRRMRSLSELQTLPCAFADDHLLGELADLKQVRVLGLTMLRGKLCRQLCDSISQL